MVNYIAIGVSELILVRSDSALSWVGLEGGLR
jgi:hypothetical protein